MLLEVEKKFLHVFGVLPKFFKNLPKSENLISSATARTETALMITQHCFIYFAEFIFKAHGMHFSRYAMDKTAAVVGAISPVSLMYGIDRPNFPLFCFHHRTPDHLHTRVIQRPHSRFKAFIISSRISSQPAALPEFSVLIVRETLYYPFPKVPPVYLMLW